MSHAAKAFCYRIVILLLFPLWSGLLWALEIQGEWQQGALLYGKVKPGAQVEFDGRQVRTTEDGRFIVGLGRDAPEQARIQVRTPSGEVEEHPFSVKQRQYNIQRVNGVPARTVNPPPEVLQRIREEAAQAWRARKRDTTLKGFLSTFVWPLEGPITGVYGSQRIYNGEPRSPHYGVDVAAPVGTSVRAPASGQVTLVHEDMYYSGGTLIIDHGHGLSSTFIHLSKILVNEGEQVTQGQPIAEVGATGRATGPHLDWRMNWFDHRIDPALVVGEMKKGSAAGD